ncbi:hypothetical protein D9619_008156 [Psilocybe cf. subviscida]|uniref:Beta-lactamase-related domain-containing protein n=1 Tax=Psilocybe cf. subviscida TaxID=2480587 RepID=A0A8H5ESF5_9AGAR|nr:hypothetical protein D9619_008156 [Psilocybe cf. subviscida]
MPSLTAQGKENLDKLVVCINFKLSNILTTAHYAHIWVDSLVQEGTLPALVVGATSADGEIYLNAGGKKIVGDESSENIDPDTVFWLCSSTKFIAHIAALQLVEKGKLDMETPVKEYFPQLGDPVIVEDMTSYTPEVVASATNTLRVKHLLNFTAGTFYVQSPNGGFELNKALTSDYVTDDKHTEFFNHLKGSLPGVPLRFEPGSNFIYGYNSDILGFIVEKISKQTLDQYMQENIFKPLGVEASFYLTKSLKEKFLPLAYKRPSDGQLEPYSNQPNVGIIAQDPSKVACLGGVGLYMSLRGYLSILRHLLQVLDGKADKPILKPETVKSLFVPQLNEEGCKSIDMLAQIFSAPGPMSWTNASATNLTDWKNRRRAGSASWGGWTGTNFWIDPTTGIAGVMGIQMLCITSGSGDPNLVKAYGTFEETLYSAIA